MDATTLQVFLVGMVVSGVVGYITVTYLPAVSRRSHSLDACSLSYRIALRPAAVRLVAWLADG